MSDQHREMGYIVPPLLMDVLLQGQWREDLTWWADRDNSTAGVIPYLTQQPTLLLHDNPHYCSLTDSFD